MTSVVFTPDGRELMSGSHDGTVDCWDMTSLGTGSEQQSVPEIRGFSGHTVRFSFCVSFYVTRLLRPQLSIGSIAFFPSNGQWIVTGSDDKTVREWDTERLGSRDGCQSNAQFAGYCKR